MNDLAILSLSIEHCIFVPPSLHAWIYAISVHGACCLVGGVTCGIVLYHTVKKIPGEKRTSGGSVDGMRSLLGLVVGAIAAASVYIGRPIIESYAPNTESAFLGSVFASTIGFATFFKSLNVAFGTYPEGADGDLLTWLLWFAMLPEPAFAKGKLSKASREEVTTKVREMLLKIIVLFFLLTILMQGSPPYFQLRKEDDGISTFEWFWAIHINGFFHLWLLYAFFSFCLDFSMIMNFALSGGVRMEPAFCNPLLGSRSFKETWGTRWNRPVNLLLKRTVYIPALKSGFCNKVMATVLTFLASGLLHEYNFSIHNHRSYRPGEVTAFFILMGLVMVVESMVWNRCFPKWLQTRINRLPSAATASMLTMMAAGLAERYFLRSWLESGFVPAVAQMLPRMKCQ